MLNGISVLHMTTGHQATDHRVYDKEARSAAALGAKVTVVAPNNNGAGDANGVRIVTAPQPGRLLGRFLFQPWICHSLSLGQKPDIIHLHDLELLQIVPVLRILMPRAKIFYDVHEDFPALVDIRGYIPGFLKAAARTTVNLFEKSLVRLTDGVVGVTQPLADHFASVPRIAVYNFPSLRFYQTAAEAAKPAKNREYDLIHLGALTPSRAHFLVEMMRLLCAFKPDIRICVAGLHRGLYDLLLPLAPRQCSLIGRIPYSQVAHLLGNARIGLDVHPFSTANLRVAIPVKVLEYMAAGCALVSSRFSLLDRLFDEAGAGDADVVWIDRGTPEVFAQAVLGVLGRIAKGEDPGTGLKDLAARGFLWEHQADKMARFYLEVLGR